jgi:hypothetical protein
MAWAPRPPDPEPSGWWVELEFARWADGVAAELRARKLGEEDAKRLRQLRRQVEKVDEQIVLAQGAAEARQHLRRQGLTYERAGSDRPEVEHSAPIGRVLSVR